MSLDQSLPASALSQRIQSRVQRGPVVAFATAGLALSLYVITLAPGLTWANFGADGGELLAAAAVNGVPHPPGYPLYIVLLQGWLIFWGWLLPESNFAWRGNLFSAMSAAISVGITAHLVYRLASSQKDQRILRAGVAALAWALSPLLWGQALITEVYALHALLFTLLAWVLLAYQPRSPSSYGLALGVVVGLGLAHHLTIALLLPAVLYWLWRDPRHLLSDGRFWGWGTLGVTLPLILYLRIPLVAGTPPPINWGYAVTPADFWWLISGAAYRHYLFGVEPSMLLAQLSQWAAVLSRQYTPIGFGVAIAGLYYLDQHRPHWRNFGLLWLLPVSVYAITYNTADSEVYLLPVVWMLAIWLPDGIRTVADFATRWFPSRVEVRRWGMAATIGGLLILTGVRSSHYSLRVDQEATGYLDELISTLEPGSLIFSSADAETFTLWYGVYASRELSESAPDLALINIALYQFPWYRRLVADLYPDLPGVGGETVDPILAANVGQRPIYFTEVIAPAVKEDLNAIGSLWRYLPTRNY
ncbi:MAG: DUF2723 domain-containing protein [Caldilineaceae bacterium]|nr:DUF2723 domain-containing protein [Caldilineaceae bacterium]